MVIVCLAVILRKSVDEIQLGFVLITCTVTLNIWHKVRSSHCAASSSGDTVCLGAGFGIVDAMMGAGGAVVFFAAGEVPISDSRFVGMFDEDVKGVVGEVDVGDVPFAGEAVLLLACCACLSASCSFWSFSNLANRFLRI